MILSIAILSILVVLLVWSTVYLYVSRWELQGSYEVANSVLASKNRTINKLTDELEKVKAQAAVERESRLAADERLIALCNIVREHMGELPIKN